MADRLLALAVALSTLAACERVEPSVIGQWSAADPDTEWTVHMREDSTWAMQVGTLEGEGTFTRGPDEDAVVLHTTGNMAEVMPRGFRGHLEADTLRLCSAAGCADMIRTDIR